MPRHCAHNKGVTRRKSRLWSSSTGRPHRGCRFPRGLWLLLATVLFGAWASFGPGPSRFGGSHSSESLAALAATVGSDDILMYGFESSPACRQARGWMDQHGFPYEICDIHHSEACAQQLTGYGENAVPYFVIRGERMLGLDEDAFVAALQR